MKQFLKAEHSNPGLQKSQNSKKNDEDHSQDGKISQRQKSLQFPTSYLQSFEYLDRAIDLENEKYLPIKKMVWYQALSTELRESKVKVGNVRTDLRFHTAFVMPSGSGKKNLINLYQELGKRRSHKITSPDSLHPEQLIGKVRERKRDDEAHYEEVRGHLDNDFVLMDESVELFKSDRDDIKQTRKYIRVAADVYGENEVEKRRTGIPQGEGISYCPKCNIALFMQPFGVKKEFALDGTLRRVFIPYVVFSPHLNTSDYVSRVRPQKEFSRKEAFDKFEETMEGLGKTEIDVLTVEDEALELFVELHRELLKQGFAYGKKARNYTKIVDHQLLESLLKFAGVQAAVNEHEKIRTDDLEKAFIDLTEIFQCNLKYIETKIRGSLDYGDDWNGARDKDRECLKRLKAKGATSKEKSDVMIQEFHEIIKNIHDTSINYARQKCDDYEDRNWIGKQQIGSHDSAVWLEIDFEGEEGEHDNEIITAKSGGNTRYKELVEKYG